MTKVSVILDQLNLSRSELAELVSDGQRRLSGMRPVHVKQVYKRCGKAGCWCSVGDGPEFGHGPYLYAVWTEGGKQYQKSLGVHFTSEQIEDLRSRSRPRWLDFVLTGKALERAKAGPRKYNFSTRDLNFVEFEQFYGLPMEEDNFNRPKSLTYDFVEFEKALNDFSEAQEMVYSSFVAWGVCTRKGYSTLKILTDRGFYLVG